VNLQLILAVLSFAKELFKYLKEKQEHNKVCAVKVKGVTNALKASKNSKDTSGLEAAFKSLTSNDLPIEDGLHD